MRFGPKIEKEARNLLIRLLFRCVKNDVRVVALYLRTNRNLGAVEIARLRGEILLGRRG